MDITMQIAAMSVSMHYGQTRQAVSGAVASKAKEFQDAQASQLIEALREMAPPITNRLDVTV